MNPKLQIFLILVIAAFFVALVILLKKKKLSLRYTLLWLLADLVLLVLAIFPDLINWFTRQVGIVSPVNAVFAVEAIFVLVIMLSLTGIVSQENRKIRKLAQENAILEKRVRDLEKLTRVNHGLISESGAVREGESYEQA
ncbi:MAG: DUF2304 domain-containing protein [Firmicutes bacterium]|nr:DUF2304 domain-containing protein [Bacillota bacterium]